MKSPRRICLIKIGSGEKQRTHLIDRTDFTVGRSPEADIVLPSTSASRLHAKFSFSSRQDAKAVTLSVQDLGSANGTFVNGERIRKRRLSPGDIVNLGKVQLTLKE